MPLKKGLTEVPDSEDELLSSSPVSAPVKLHTAPLAPQAYENDGSATGELVVGLRASLEVDQTHSPKHVDEFDKVDTTDPQGINDSQQQEPSFEHDEPLPELKTERVRLGPPQGDSDMSAGNRIAEEPESTGENREGTSHITTSKAAEPETHQETDHETSDIATLEAETQPVLQLPENPDNPLHVETDKTQAEEYDRPAFVPSGGPVHLVSGADPPNDQETGNTEESHHALSPKRDEGEMLQVSDNMCPPQQATDENTPSYSHDIPTNLDLTPEHPHNGVGESPSTACSVARDFPEEMDVDVDASEENQGPSQLEQAFGDNQDATSELKSSERPPAATVSHEEDSMPDPTLPDGGDGPVASTLETGLPNNAVEIGAPCSAERKNTSEDQMDVDVINSVEEAKHIQEQNNSEADVKNLDSAIHPLTAEIQYSKMSNSGPDLQKGDDTETATEETTMHSAVLEPGGNLMTEQNERQDDQMDVDIHSANEQYDASTTPSASPAPIQGHAIPDLDMAETELTVMSTTSPSSQKEPDVAVDHHPIDAGDTNRSTDTTTPQDSRDNKVDLHAAEDDSEMADAPPDALKGPGIAVKRRLSGTEDPSPQKKPEETMKPTPRPSTPAKGSQEATLAELRAQRTALIAALAALPNVRELIAEDDDSSFVSSPGSDTEPTDAEIMTAANKAVKKHIKLLHEYNEMKDAGQGLMGLIADSRGVRIVEIQDEFGIGEKD